MGVGIRGVDIPTPHLHHQNRYGWQAGGTHSTGMFSCLSVFATLKCSRCKKQKILQIFLVQTFLRDVVYFEFYTISNSV